MAEEQWGSRA
jgi:hypothetical protein